MSDVPVLSIKNLVVTFHTSHGDVPAVRGLNLNLRLGETLGLLGESGSGKSTVAWSILGLVPHPGRIGSGQVHLGERDLLAGQDELRKVRGSEIGFIVPNARAHLNPLLPVGKQIAAVYRAHNEVSGDEAHERAIDMLKRVAIPDAEARAKAYPHEMSGGMAQRVIIAMATVNSPRVLIADEPTMGLDVTIQSQILELLAEQVQELGASMLLITRDLGIAARYCDRLAVLRGGQLIEEAPARDFFASPQHPYSAALLSAAVLDVGDSTEAPALQPTESIQGSV